MDAAVFAALAPELTRELRQARLEKIVAVNPREWWLLWRGVPGAGGRPERTLVLSLDGPLARVHLEPPGPGRPSDEPAASPFLLLVRRHLGGCRLDAIHHPAWERILHFAFLGPADEFPRRRLTLAYELLGAQGNLLLLEAQGILLGALRPLSERQTRLVAGAPYAPPPPPPATPAAPLSYLQRALALAPAATPLRSALVRNVGGLSPWAAAALAREAGLAPDAPCASLSPANLIRLHERVSLFAQSVAEGRFSPVLWREGDKAREFWVYPAPAPPGWSAEPQPSANAAVAEFFAGRLATARFAQARQALRQRLDAQLARLERKLTAQRGDLARAEAADDLRRAGEAILANLAHLDRGLVSFTGASYADPTPLAVALDPRLSPSENAQRYFDRYRKAKRGQEKAAARVAATADLLSRTRQACFEAREAEDPAELRALAAELVAEGVLEEAKTRVRSGRKPARAAAPPSGKPKPNPRRYRSTDGYDILAGRNSRENDWLTLRSGAPHDLWFHVKDLAGAHVILRLPGEGDPLESTLWEAAQVAAYHSEGRESSQVPVDYTLRRHVRKPPGGRLGQVLYDHHRTLYVTPDPALIARLRAR
jgi:predicted ribosome quality control (RQC) complex YloA/Tae2 family protein